MYTIAGFGTQHHPNVAIGKVERRVVSTNHYRPTGVPRSCCLRAQQPIDAIVPTKHTHFATAMGAQNLQHSLFF
jgi:hypothetical protein